MEDSFESKWHDLLFGSTSFGRSGFILPQGSSDVANSEGFFLLSSHHNKNEKDEEPCEAARGDADLEEIKKRSLVIEK